MFGYAPQRQMFPLMHSFTSASAGPTWFLQQRRGRHDLTRSAIAALISVMRQKRRLHWIEIFRLAETFNRGDLIVFVHGGKDEARVHPSPIDVHRAGAALPVVASLFRSREMQIFAETIEQCRARIDSQIVILSVYLKLHRNRAFRRPSR